MSTIQSISIPDDLTDFIKELKDKGQFSSICVKLLREYKEKMRNDFPSATSLETSDDVFNWKELETYDWDKINALSYAQVLSLLNTREDIDKFIQITNAKKPDRYIQNIKMQKKSLLRALAVKLRISADELTRWLDDTDKEM